jgi:hypothetical protein
MAGYLLIRIPNKTPSQLPSKPSITLMVSFSQGDAWIIQNPTTSPNISYQTEKSIT